MPWASGAVMSTFISSTSATVMSREEMIVPSLSLKITVPEPASPVRIDSDITPLLTFKAGSSSIERPSLATTSTVAMSREPSLLRTSQGMRELLA